MTSLNLQAKANEFPGIHKPFGRRNQEDLGLALKKKVKRYRAPPFLVFTAPVYLSLLLRKSFVLFYYQRTVVRNDVTQSKPL